jgi:carbonic anhydrase
VTNSINDILALDGFVKVNDILIVHHTDCGTTHFKDPVIREGLKARLPDKAQEIERMAFGAIQEYVFLDSRMMFGRGANYV